MNTNHLIEADVKRIKKTLLKNSKDFIRMPRHFLENILGSYSEGEYGGLDIYLFSKLIEIMRETDKRQGEDETETILTKNELAYFLCAQTFHKSNN